MLEISVGREIASQTTVGYPLAVQNVNERTRVTFQLSFALANGQQAQIPMEAGEVLFVLGANGTGKSSLMQRLYTQARPNSRRISAHRQTWFTSNTLDLTPTGKKNTESNITNSDNNEQSRYRDDYAAQRASMTVFELIDAQNVRARSIAASVDAADIEGAITKSGEEAPLKAINSLLRQSNIPIEIDVIESEQIVARKNGGSPYSIAELSDGERNALLIAGDVLTAKPGTLLIIDEPERHLHRSIISPLLSLLFSKRTDCAFVIATHDVDLPLDNEHAKVLLVRSALYIGQTVQSWEADLLEVGAPLDEDIRRDVMGSRRNILFVEGKEESLDKPLYSLVFPMVSVVAKESCKGVEQAVAGLRGIDGLTWVHAWGIVDGDNQDQDRLASLAARGIFAVPFYSVESVYYHPWIIERVAARIAQITSGDPAGKTAAAIDAGIARVRQQQKKMVLKAATKAARDIVMNSLPTVPSISAAEPVSVSINTSELVTTKEAELERRLDAKDWVAVVTTCPIRESGALDPISKAVGFIGRRDYESAVRTMLTDDAEALSFVRELFAGAYAAVVAA